MVPINRPDVLDGALRILGDFALGKQVRGRFVSLYLGLRRMRAENNVLAELGSSHITTASEIEQFLDCLYTKSHRCQPFVVLTAPFGGSTSQGAPYSALSRTSVPGLSYSTNTWRNNFGIQKGVGCLADPDVITQLLDAPQHRLACPHMTRGTKGKYRCSISGTDYRGEDHAIWLRRVDGGYQVVDLNRPAVFREYLRPSGHPIPIFPLIGMLYCMAMPGVYPERNQIGIPEFAADFGFTPDQVVSLFECDPESESNSAFASIIDDSVARISAVPSDSESAADQLPEEPSDAILNTGVGAEILIARDLQSCGWEVRYRANQRGLGYDLEATRDGQTLFVEVKSSVSSANLELQQSEWSAAQSHGDCYVLAVVDFFGSTNPRIWYVRNPAASAEPVERTIITYRFARENIEPMKTDVDFL